MMLPLNRGRTEKTGRRRHEETRGMNKKGRNRLGERIGIFKGKKFKKLRDISQN